MGDHHISSYEDNCVTFTLNGRTQKEWRLQASASLFQYLREVARLFGTKVMCREGGCGSCIVHLTRADPATGLDRQISVNSCLFPLYGCHGASVTTVEGIGSSREGYHPVQTRLAHFYGTQCGYCSPGWVMAMYSLLKMNRNLSMKQIEDSFGSNNCRCTGYRPILDAFKSFAVDSSHQLCARVTDIEDLLKEGRIGKCKIKLSEEVSNHSQEVDEDADLQRHFAELALCAPKLKITCDSGIWYRVTSLREVFEIFTMVNGSYMLVGGNTAQGVFEKKYPPPPDVYIDLAGVAELQSHWFESGGALAVGAGLPLTETERLFRAVAVERPAEFRHLEALADHILKVAHLPVRNVGTLAGNLTIKHKCQHFQSDLFTIFETVSASIAIDAGSAGVSVVSLPEFLATNMYKKVITKLLFPPLDKTYTVKTYKVARRAQNDHAVINAGFCFSFHIADNYRVLKIPSIVFGGLSPDFIHAHKTERYLVGRRLLDAETLRGALATLNVEASQADQILPDATIEYRRGLVTALFYRFVLSLAPDRVSARMRSGALDLDRPLSSGRQLIFSDPAEYPLTQPLPKIESLIQCSGELQYTGDALPIRGQLFGALVLSDCGPAKIVKLDPSAALKIPGVVAFYSAKDIPGVNTFVTILYPYTFEYEELFASSEVRYAGQSVGMVVAQTQALADFAAQRVRVEYLDVKRPLLYVQDVLTSRASNRIKYMGSIEPTAKKGVVVHKINGSFSDQGQYHYYYETQTAAVVPTDSNTLEVTVATQWMQFVQEAISIMLNIPNNRITVQVKQCGGSYGGKIIRANLPACAAALAAFLLQRPVSISLDLETNMRAIGGRFLTYCQYEVAVNNVGVIQYLGAQVYFDQGASYNDTRTDEDTINDFKSVYDASTWCVKFYDVITDKATTTSARAPGALGAVAIVEKIMEHIAWTVRKDPLNTRLVNLAADNPVPEYAADLRLRSDYDSRLADCRSFNQANQWKKRGITLVPMKYNTDYQGIFYALLSVYRLDGTVAISHGAIELGQGVNTKVAQVAAHELGIPLDFIQVMPSNTVTSPNNKLTAGSSSTDSVCFAVKECCKELNARLSPVRAALPDGTSWIPLIEAAYAQQLNLCVTYMVKRGDYTDYVSYGTSALEVEIDCLTGERKIIRVDILQNVGNSLNPYIDVGQIEGAYLMGLGYCLSELLVYHPDTGLLLTDRTWEYKVPGAKDIPVDWRIYFKKDPNYPCSGAFGSKSVSEAPLLMSVAVVAAIRQALQSLRRDLGLPDTFISNDPPCTTESTYLRGMVKYTNYTL